MFVDPTTAALRSDNAPQRLAQHAVSLAVEAWNALPGAAALTQELKAFGAGAPLAENGQLEKLFTRPGAALCQMRTLSRIMIECMQDHAIAHPPFRNGFNGRTGTVLLAYSGRAQLMLHFCEPGVYSNPSHSFSDALRYDAVIGGEAQARLVRMLDTKERAARFSRETLVLSEGTQLALDLGTESLEIESVTRRIVTLRLLRTASQPGPALEYSATDGALLQQSAGKLSTSRQEAIVALLGRMQRVDAAPYLAAIAAGEGDVSLRWQALRECLALDTATGFAALSTLARQSDDPLSPDAGALRAKLIETYPQLAKLENVECRA